MATLPYRERGLKRARRDPSEPAITIRVPLDVERALRKQAAEDRTSIVSVIIAALDQAGVTTPPAPAKPDAAARTLPLFDEKKSARARRSSRKGGE